MKKIILLSFLSFIPYFIQAQQSHTIQTEPKIEEVIVYLDGAEIKNTQTLRLVKGRNTIVFKNLSSSMDEKSVQITTANDIEIFSISSAFKSLSYEEANPAIGIWEDSLALLKDKMDLINNQINAYTTEQKLLAENQKLGGKESGTTIAELVKAADFYRERTLKINNSLTTLTNQLRDVTVHSDRVFVQWNRLRSQVDTIRGEITLVLQSPIDQQTDIQLRYLVTNAKWNASYDLIAADINKPVSIKYNALIYNNTGIDWKNTKLRLSTGDPSLAATRPQLTTWILNYQSAANEGFVQNMSNAKQDMLFELNRIKEDDYSAKITASDLIQVSELAATFTIDKIYTINSNSQPYKINITNQSLNAIYEYITVPKMDMSAFLVAKVTGWEKLNLIDGTANVYFGNTYIGESQIDIGLLSDTLELSLGRDNQVVVKRAKIEDFAATKSISNKKSETLTYEISVRNNKTTPIQIKIQDQIPVSQESDISVETNDISGAELDTPSGRLQWKRQIASGETAKYKIAFTVKYPKNKNISLRKSRVVRTPRFK
ncbi:DUF4139 domain-containing protein [Cytophagaceae bacterium DM2B3-1]|uniref:DUF4139 domain-containing protein n=1 Tax=Xanthocytophaga flava TaxID=3048013 RepID=A0ABT7CVF4_9BACT|nr:DUF4139 domain-containing protein [Xanthocytophaga flavus]MDJ1497695.1 DUF4139 domain-containing protein [Xanthocytophaga flavus]